MASIDKLQTENETNWLSHVKIESEEDVYNIPHIKIEHFLDIKEEPDSHNESLSVCYENVKTEYTHDIADEKMHVDEIKKEIEYSDSEETVESADPNQEDPLNISQFIKGESVTTVLCDCTTKPW